MKTGNILLSAINTDNVTTLLNKELSKVTHTAAHVKDSFSF